MAHNKRYVVGSIISIQKIAHILPQYEPDKSGQYEGHIEL